MAILPTSGFQARVMPGLPPLDPSAFVVDNLAAQRARLDARRMALAEAELAEAARRDELERAARLDAQSLARAQVNAQMALDRERFEFNKEDARLDRALAAENIASLQEQRAARVQQMLNPPVEPPREPQAGDFELTTIMQDGVPMRARVNMVGGEVIPVAPAYVEPRQPALSPEENATRAGLVELFEGAAEAGIPFTQYPFRNEDGSYNIVMITEATNARRKQQAEEAAALRGNGGGGGLLPPRAEASLRARNQQRSGAQPVNTVQPQPATVRATPAPAPRARAPAPQPATPTPAPQAQAGNTVEFQTMAEAERAVDSLPAGTTVIVRATGDVFVIEP